MCRSLGLLGNSLKLVSACHQLLIVENFGVYILYTFCFAEDDITKGENDTGQTDKLADILTVSQETSTMFCMA